MIYLLMTLCILFDISYIVCKKNDKAIAGLISKTIAAICFIIIGYLGYKQNNCSFSFFILLGLILDGIGDLLLALRNVCLKKIMFFVGAVSFLCGHIMYVRALVGSNNNYLLGSIILGVVLGLTLYYCLTRICSFSKVYRYFGIVYCSMILIILCLAIGTYFTSRTSANLVFVLGAFLFVCSDTLLILNTFSKKFDDLHPLYSILYFVAQILISYSLLLI